MQSLLRSVMPPPNTPPELAKHLLRKLVLALLGVEQEILLRLLSNWRGRAGGAHSTHSSGEGR